MKLFSTLRLFGIAILLLAEALIFIVSAQDKKISLNVTKKPLSSVLNEIESKSGYSFLVRSNDVDLDEPVTISVSNKSVRDILFRLFNERQIRFEISGNSISIFKPQKVQESTDGKAVETKKVSGLVTDQNGEPIIGATIQVKDNNKLGTISDVNGKFNLEIPLQATLTVSYIGYSPIEVKGPVKDNQNIVLREMSKTLNEVVVVGYGTQKKINLSGSVGMVTADDIASRPVSSVANGLQGLLTGVTVVNPTGQPGSSSSTIRIRGLGTIGNANPLILVDGVEGDMNILNPEDIQSISVLKDAASAAIYGARAANGVILVTTKNLNTKDKKPTISLNAYYGVQTPTRLPEMCDAVDFMTLDNEARTNVGSAIAWNDSQFEKVKTGSSPNYFGNTDWISKVLNSNAPQQSYSLNVNGNVGNSGYIFSYRYFDQDGLTVGNSTGEKRHNLRLKIDSRLLNKVQFTTNIGYTVRNVISPVSSLTSGGGAIYNAMRIAPNVPVHYTDGSWAYGGGNTNPVAILYDGGNNNLDADELSLMAIGKVDIMKGWDITTTYSAINKNSLVKILKKTINFVNPEDPETIVYSYNNPNSLSNADLRQRQQTLIVQSNFDFSVGNHNFSGVGGFEQEWAVLQQFDASRLNLITEDDPTLNLGSTDGMSNDASASQWAIRSFFGRLNYNFSDRYLLEMNYRLDMSSRFSKEYRTGRFPSFSGAWRLSEEPFMAFSRKLFDNIKVRGSWGMLGNQYVGSTDFPYLSVLNEVTGLSTIGTLATSGYTQTTLANPQLSWEKIKMLDFGADVSLLKNRLEITFDWYKKNTSGILLQLNYPAQIGATPSEQNAGSVSNKGWEVNVAWRDKIGQLKYGISLNLSDVKNKITDLAGMSPDLSSYQIRQVGFPIDAFYGYVSEGLMTPDDFGYYDETEKKYSIEKVPVVIGNDYEPGDIKYKDISGPQGKPDGKISPEYDRVVLGSSIPRYTYAFKGDLQYKNIDFSFSVQGVGKCKGYLTGTARHAFQDMAAYPQKIHLQRYNVETNPDPNAAYPRLTYNVSFNQSTFSTYWLEDATYLRLKNIQLGYTLPQHLTRKAKIERCRVYASADNLLTLTDFFYAYDPETPVSSGGYYPQIKTCVIGLNITFQ